MRLIIGDDVFPARWAPCSPQSRAAFQALCEQLWASGFRLLDGQLPNPNLEQLGAQVVDREAYLGLLKEALAAPMAWPVRPSAPE